MRRGQLCDYFTGVGVKRLVAVEANPAVSNQHEINTTRLMRDHILGENHEERFQVVYLWLGEDQDGFTWEGTATHYDSRRDKDHRSAEWRLYYSSNPITQAMQAGDTLFLAIAHNRLIYFIVTPQKSTSERQLSWLFDLYPRDTSFLARNVNDDGEELDFAARFILDEIGIEFEHPDEDKLDTIIERFQDNFPATNEFSNLARLSLPQVTANDDPDFALVSWLDHEEAMFRLLERRIVSKRLEEGFIDDKGVPNVDEFISYSLSVHNRRKSRMGRSLRNHLEAIFNSFDIPHVIRPLTERNQRPDFLFPSLEAYRASPDSGNPNLTMLGARSSCKGRWRQVLGEASKIHRKHLLTLEPGISEAQTSQMEASNLQLVVPESIQQSYTERQRSRLWSLADFIRGVDEQS